MSRMRRKHASIKNKKKESEKKKKERNLRVMTVLPFLFL